MQGSCLAAPPLPGAAQGRFHLFPEAEGCRGSSSQGLLSRSELAFWDAEHQFLVLLKAFFFSLDFSSSFLSSPSSLSSLLFSLFTLGFLQSLTTPRVFS